MLDIKFEYIYSDGLNHIRKIFTLDEISNGDCYDIVSDSPLLAKFVIIAKRQYTGLKDKNGVEIYDGDYILNKYGDVDYIVFRYGSFGMYKLADGDYMTLDRYNEECEVIGNIYEKQELLQP